jgi:hypothetical protein
VTITDGWSSADGQQHQLDAYYDETTDDANYLTAGHDTTWDLSWTSDGFKSYPAGTQLPVAGSAGRSLFVKPDGATPDSGDGMNPIGALTYGQEPSELILRRASATNGVANWQERYQRTVPASGRVTIVHVYSHAFSLAEVQALAQEAAAALGAPADATPAPAESAPAGASLGPSPAAAPSATAAPKCRVPKLKGRTLRAAKLSLRKAHCRVGKVSRRSSARVRAGRVIGSKPGPGRVRAAGTRIAVTVARAELASQN